MGSFVITYIVHANIILLKLSVKCCHRAVVTGSSSEAHYIIIVYAEDGSKLHMRV